MNDQIQNSSLIIKEEISAPASPAQTVLQGGSASPSETAEIRFRRLESLTNDEHEGNKSPFGDVEDVSDDTDVQDEDNLTTALAIAPFSSSRNSATSTLTTSEIGQWHKTCCSLKDKLKFILENENSYKDVTFVVGKDEIERISAHKLICRIGSPVLEKIMNRLTTTVSDVIEIPEVEPVAFRFLLKFLYTDQFEPTNVKCPCIMSVLQAARLFEVRELANQCVQALKNHISDETAISLSEMGKDIDDSNLRDLALSYICRNVKRIFFSNYFMDMSYANLVLLIENDELEWDELSIFKSIVRWADYFCKRKGLEPVSSNLRGALGEIIYKVRFPLMTAEQFTFEVIPLKVLTSEEQVQVYKYISLSDYAKREQLEPTSFNCKPRNHMRNQSPSFSKSKIGEDSYGKGGESNISSHGMTSTSTDHSDMESEGEGENTSQVSSNTSSVFVKKRRLTAKSPSPMSPPSTSSKHSSLFGKSPPRRSKLSESRRKKRKSIDPDTSIQLDGGEISFNDFIEECQMNPNRKEIELIKLTGVGVTDYNKLNGKKVRFPKLKDFHLDMKISSFKHSEVNALAQEMNIEDYLFFVVKVQKPRWTLKEIWSLEINITVTINGITILKIDHNRKSMIVSKLKDCAKIVESIEGESDVKSIVISHMKFPGHIDKFPAQSLERLVLLSIKEIPEFHRFIRKFKRLRELCVLTSDVKKIDLSSDIVSKDRLRKLSIGLAKFVVSTPTPLRSLEELFLWRCEWCHEFEDNFATFFPNLKKVSFFLGNKVAPRFLKKALTIKSIEEIGCGSFDWTGSSEEDTRVAKEILETAGISMTDKSFVLQKSLDDNNKICWIGKKGSAELSQEEIFKNFQFYNLYDSYQLFRS